MNNALTDIPKFNELSGQRLLRINFMVFIDVSFGFLVGEIKNTNKCAQ